MFKPETDSKEEEWIIQGHLQVHVLEVLCVALYIVAHTMVIDMTSLLLDYVIKQLIMYC